MLSITSLMLVHGSSFTEPANREVHENTVNMDSVHNPTAPPTLPLKAKRVVPHFSHLSLTCCQHIEIEKDLHMWHNPVLVSSVDSKKVFCFKSSPPKNICITVSETFPV